MTQRQLADASGVTQSLLSAYERGAYSPSWDVAVALAYALGVSVAAFAVAPGEAKQNAT